MHTGNFYLLLRQANLIEIPCPEEEEEFLTSGFFRTLMKWTYRNLKENTDLNYLSNFSKAGTANFSRYDIPKFSLLEMRMRFVKSLSRYETM